MISYADVTKFAHEAYMNALFAQSQNAYEAALQVAQEMGLSDHAAQAMAEEIGRICLTSAQRSTDTF